jgi:hypothetical protein
MIEKLGGRKFIVSLLVLISSFVLVLVSKLDVSEFIKSAEIILGIYGVTNVASKIVNK